MRLIPWKPHKNRVNAWNGSGLRRQTQVKNNLEEPIEEEPETIEKAVRIDPGDPMPGSFATKATLFGASNRRQ
jgi:hypothetical protein